MNLIRYDSRIIQYQSRGSEINTYSPLSDPNIRLAYCAFPFPGYTGNTLRIWKPSTNQEMDISNIYDSSFRSWLGNDTPYVRRIYNQTSNTAFDARNTLNNIRIPILDLVTGEIKFDGTDGNFDTLYPTSSQASGGVNLLNNSSTFHCIFIGKAFGTFQGGNSGYGSPINTRRVDNNFVAGWNIYSAPVGANRKWEFWTGRGSAAGFDIVYGESIVFGKKQIVTVERTSTITRIYDSNHNIIQSLTVPYQPTGLSDNSNFIGLMDGTLSALILSADSAYLTQNQQFLSNKFQEKRVMT